MKRPVFCPMITSKDIGGGIKSTIALMNGLQSEGHDVTVLLPVDCEYLSKFNQNINKLFFDLTPNITLAKPITYFLLCLQLRKKLQKFDEKTLYFCSDRPALMLALFLPLRTTIFYVSRGWFYTNWSARFLRAFLFPRVKCFIGISQKQYDLMKNYSPKQKVCLIENGIELPKSNFVPFKKQKISIATIGGICDRKNQMQCLEVVNTLKEKYPIELLIFGTTFTKQDQVYKEKLEKYIRDSNLGEHVAFKGHESDFDLIFGQSDIILSTAKEEGFGRTIIESMGYGIPVVANQKSGGPSMIIDHGTDGLLYDSSLNDLSAKIELLINDVHLRETIIKNGLAKMRDKYTVQKMAKNYSNLIENEG